VDERAGSVVKHPYYAVTDRDGFFKLADVPPGEYEIEAWHEGWRIVSEEKVLALLLRLR
jgi:hypothetical protein